MKPRRITTDAEYQRLKRRLVDFATELDHADATLFPPKLDAGWREAFRTGYAGQLADLEHALRFYARRREAAATRRAEPPASGTGAG